MDYECTGCGSRYASVWALDACELEHEADDARTRAWLRGRRPDQVTVTTSSYTDQA